MFLEKRKAPFACDAKGGNTTLAGRSYDGDNGLIVAACIFFLLFIILRP